MSSDVIVERHQSVAVCTMNRAQQHNAITPGLNASLLEAWRECDADPDCGAIVTRSAGTNFSVGADGSNLSDWTKQPLSEVFSENFAGKQGTEYQYDAQATDSLGLNRWAFEVLQISTPMVASVRGIAAGGGLSLALLHHFRIVDESALFAAGFGQLGLSGELGCTLLLPCIVGQQTALRMMVADQKLDAQAALNCELADKCVDSDALDSATLEFAETITKQPKEANRASIRAILAPRQKLLEDILELEVRQQEALWSSSEFSRRVDLMLGRIGKRP